MSKSNKKFKSIHPNILIAYQKGCVKAANEIVRFYGSRIERAIIASYSTKNLGVYISIDDITQEALIHFLEAGKGFDVLFDDNKQNSDHFFNFCIKKMHWRLLDYIRLLSRRYNKSQSNAELLKNNATDVEETYTCMPDVMFENSLDKALEKLSKRDKHICMELLQTESISDKSLKSLGLNKTYCLSIFRNFKTNFTNKIRQSEA